MISRGVVLISSHLHTPQVRCRDEVSGTGEMSAVQAATVPVNVAIRTGRTTNTGVMPVVLRT